MGYSFEIICASAFTVSCVISAVIYTCINRLYTYWDQQKVNGPIPRYVYGNWGGFKEKFIGSQDYANILKYGKVCGTYDGFTPNLLVTDPELIKEILDTSRDKFQDIRFARESSVVLKDSLLSLSGREKPEVQILTGSLLNPQKLGKLIPKLEESAETLEKCIIENRSDNGLINITSAVKEFIEEVIALSVFGIELNADVKFKDEFVKNIERVMKEEEPNSIFSLFPSFYDNFKDHWVCPEKVLQFIVNLVISGITESSSEAVINEGKASNLIDLLVEAAKEEKKMLKKEKEDENPDLVLTDNTIISKCLASVLSLKNATRTALVLGIYALSNDEEVQQKLYEEVEKNKSEVTSYENIEHLSYLDKVVKEVLRMYPFEFRLERVCMDKIFLGGIFFSKPIRVSIPLYALHHLEDYYPEPDKFDPERFSQSECEKRNPYTYLPFGQAGFNGSDISLQLAVLTTKLILFRLIQKFKFSIPQKQNLNRLFKKGFTRVPQPEDIEVFVETRM